MIEMAEAKLIKIDRNGSKHFEGRVKCDRCGGTGTYTWGAVINGCPQYAGVCFKCDGAGWVIDTWIERTPEYQAKLDAKRAEKQAKVDARRKAEEERIEAEHQAKLERIKAEKAISQYVGEIGQKIEITCQYIGSPSFERTGFGGYGRETCYIHTFKDENGNKIVWKTTSYLDLEEDQMVKIRATVKEHSEYRDEKQTSVIRLKVIEETSHKIEGQLMEQKADPSAINGEKGNDMNKEVKKWRIEYSHKDGRSGTVEATTEIQQSGGFQYGNGKGGALKVDGQIWGYDLRYASGDLHKVMLDEYFGDGLVEAKEIG